MEWLNVNLVRTATHATMFLITRGDSMNFEAVISELTKLRWKESPSPDLLEDTARKIVEQARPHLKGCSIIFVAFEPSVLGWQIVVEHPSLPEVPLGCELKREYLLG